MVWMPMVHDTCGVRLAVSSLRTHHGGAWLATNRPLPQGACGVGTETTISMGYMHPWRLSAAKESAAGSRRGQSRLWTR